MGPKWLLRLEVSQKQAPKQGKIQTCSKFGGECGKSKKVTRRGGLVTSHTESHQSPLESKGALPDPQGELGWVSTNLTSHWL